MVTAFGKDGQLAARARNNARRAAATNGGALYAKHISAKGKKGALLGSDNRKRVMARVRSHRGGNAPAALTSLARTTPKQTRHGIDSIATLFKSTSPVLAAAAAQLAAGPVTRSRR